MNEAGNGRGGGMRLEMGGGGNEVVNGRGGGGMKL